MDTYADDLATLTDALAFAGCDPRGTLDGRRRSGEVYCPSRLQARVQGGADRCRAAVDAEDRSESGRIADGGVRPNPAIALWPIARSFSRILRSRFTDRTGPARGFAGLAGLVLAAGHAGWIQSGFRLHPGIFRDRLYQRLVPVRRADALPARRRRPDCAPRPLVAAASKMVKGADAEGLSRRAARPVLDT